MTAGPDATYNAYLAEGEFRIQRCGACGVHVFFPRLLCPSCGSSALEWVKASGAGTVYSTTTMSRRAESGGNFNVALIDLAEGPRLMSRVDGVAPESVRVGMTVRAKIAEQGEGRFLVVFEPDTAAP